MDGWEYILRRTDLISEKERFKKLRLEKSKRKRQTKTNAQIDAEKTRLAEYQETIARQLSARQVALTRYRNRLRAAEILAGAEIITASGGGPSGSAPPTVEVEITTEAGDILTTQAGASLITE